MQVITTTDLMRPIADFSHAAMADDIIFLGAMAGTDTKAVVAGSTPGRTDFAAQTNRIFENLRTVLGHYGSDAGDLLRLKVYLSDMRNHGAYMAMFTEHFPEVTFDHVVIGSEGYPLPHAVIELDAIASVRGATPPLKFASTRLRLREKSRAETTEEIGVSIHDMGQPPDHLVFAGVTAAAPGHLDAVLAALGDATGDAMPPVACCSAMLGDYDADAVVELVFADVPPALGTRQGNDDWPAYAVSGDFAFLSGRDWATAGADTSAQVYGVLESVAKTLAEINFPSRSLLRTYNLLVDWRDYGAFNAAYAKAVVWPFPPRTTMLTGIRPGARFQMESIAYRHPDRVTVLQVPKESGQ